MAEYFKEVTPLTQYDCFIFFAREKTEFDFPVHSHEEFELNLILNGSGVKRVVGDHIGEIEDMELVLIGSNVPHGWLTHKYKHKENTPKIFEITIQFHKDLLDPNFLQRNQLFYVKDLIEKAASGVLFGKETIEKIKDRIISITSNKGFYSVIELLTILHELSVSSDMVLLSNDVYRESMANQKGDRLDAILKYLHDHYDTDITLSQIAKAVSMTEVSFSRFIKKRTGKTFVDLLNEIRLGQASRKLIDSYATVSEIAFNCGFKNLSYFNRVFKVKKGKTPNEFRNDFHKFGKKTII
ncbi:MAG TPA: AraC family transcriptional regulator [Saprospiraceae bacterium]|nr:AraC family transcriptional regulator [Saprospiraceae bacterium]